MTPSSPTTSKSLSLISVKWQHTPIKFKQVGQSCMQGLWQNAFTQPCLTLWDCFKKFRVSDDLTVLHLWHTIGFLGLAPEVGASVHAGYVEDSYALQRHAAEVQRSPTTLGEAKQQVVVCTHSWTKAKLETLAVMWITDDKFWCWNSNLDHETILQLFARGRDGLRSGKLKIPKFVLHSEKTTENIID